MKRRVLAALLWAGLASPALAQPSTLTIGLREDPDVLDPTLGSAFVSRVAMVAETGFDLKLRVMEFASSLQAGCGRAAGPGAHPVRRGGAPGAVRQAVGRERADLPLLYLWTARNVVGTRRGLAGFVQVPDGLIRLRGVTLGP